MKSKQSDVVVQSPPSHVSADWQQAASSNRVPVKNRRYELLYIDYYFILQDVKISRVKNKVNSKTANWSGHFSSLEKLLCNKMELKRWIVIDMRWKR